MSVVVAVLAGVDLVGGFGSVVGVWLAALALVLIEDGFVVLNWSQFVEEIAEGALLLIVLAAQVLWVREGARRFGSRSGAGTARGAGWG
jgi:ribose/xylose/arabinose/galactoside ABC-type transport system permease subunit